MFHADLGADAHEGHNKKVTFNNMLHADARG
jgi:hypothetical protein